MKLEQWRSGWLDYRRRRFWAWVAIVLYALAGFVVAPWLARGMIVDALESRLDVEANLDDVDFNPFFLSVRLEGFHLAEPSGRTLVKFDALEADFQSSSLFRRAYTFAALRIVNPFVELVRTGQGFNLRRLVPPSQPADATVEEGASPLRLLISHLEVNGGRLDFEDQTTPEPYRTQLGPVEVVVNDLNTLPDREGRQQITVVGEGGARLDWSGTIALNPLHSSGSARLTGLPLRRLSVYVPASIAAAVDDGVGEFSFDYALRFDPAGALSTTVDNVTVGLDRIRIVRRSAEAAPSPIFELTGMKLSGGTFEWPARSISVARVELSQPTVWLDRDAEGRFTWQSVYTRPGVSAVEPPSAPTGNGTTDAGSASWQVSVAAFAVEGGAVKFDDATLTPAAQFGIGNLALDVQSVSLAEQARMPFTLGFAVASGGTVTADGSFVVNPQPELAAKVNVSALALTAIQPYLEPSTWLEVRSGTLEVEGEVASTPAEALSYQGKAAILDLSVVHSDSAARIADWKSLSAAGIRFEATARQAELATVALEDAFARIHINDTGELNVRALLREPHAVAATGDATPAIDEAAVAAPEEPGDETAPAPWAVKVTRFDLARSGTDFSDDSVPIPFRTAIADLNGRLTALDTTSRKAADIELEGKVGEYGQVRVEGALQPLDIGRDTAFTARFTNIDLRDATPYAIRFAGHRIESGKLDLDTHYEVHDRALNAEHDIVLRDFVLGERVEHPDALDLPLALAVSLLKGPDGTIAVDLPIEGDVDDPEFRIGGIIRQAILNLITKIITAPFRLLGLLVGMGDDGSIDRIVFDAGESTISPPEQEKIVKLAQALALRPQLQLGVPAAAAPAEDGVALREAQVRSRIDTAAVGADQSRLRSVVEEIASAVVAVEEREALTAQFTTPATEGAASVFDEIAYIDALRQRLVAAEPLDPAALETLAQQRRDAVIAALLAQPGIDEGRITRGDFVEVAFDDGEIPLVFTVDALSPARQAE